MQTSKGSAATISAGNRALYRPGISRRSTVYVPSDRVAAVETSFQPDLVFRWIRISIPSTHVVGAPAASTSPSARRWPGRRNDTSRRCSMSSGGSSVSEGVGEGLVDVGVAVGVWVGVDVEAASSSRIVAVASPSATVAPAGSTSRTVNVSAPSGERSLKICMGTSFNDSPGPNSIRSPVPGAA